MSKGFPCPNPTCTHVFPPGAVQGASSLTCPLCGAVFQFRSGGPAAPARAAPPSPPAKASPDRPRAARRPRERSAPASKPPAPPPAPRRPAPPAAAPVAPAVPLAAPVAPPAGPAPALAFESDPDIVVAPRVPRRRGGPLRYVIGAVVFLGLVAVVGGVGWLVWPYLTAPDDPLDAAALRTQGNFELRKPGRPWRYDQALQARMKVNLAYSQRRPRTHFAVFFRDYRTRSPSEAELLDVALKKLRGYFHPGQVDYEDPFARKAGEAGTLGDKPAYVLEFLASDAQEVTFSGQCFMMTHGGYGYWFFAWAPTEDREAVVDKWEGVRQGFALLGEREGWTPRPRVTEPFTGTAASYRLDYAKDLWRRQEKAEESDAAVELELRGFEPMVDEETGRARTVEHAGRAATVQVLVLPKAASLDEAERAAKAYVLKKEAAAHPQAAFEPVKDTKTGQPVVLGKVGAITGRLAKLELKLAADASRYAWLGVVSRAEGVLAVYAECPSERRDFWEQEFRALLATVRERRR